MVVRLLKSSELNSIQMFLKLHWKTSILSENSNFFRWMFHRDLKKKEIDFVIETDDSSNQIIGCLGFIQTKNFLEDNESKKNTIWLTNWKSISSNSLSAIKLLRYLEVNFEYEMIGTIGCNLLAKNIYKLLGYKTGIMQRYAIVNYHLSNFKILNKKNIEINQNRFCLKYKRVESKISIERINKDFYLTKNCNLKILNKNLPYKDFSYLKNRYFDHPIYKYEIYLVYDKKEFIYIVLRKCFKEDSFAYRIVDIIGDLKIFDMFSQKIVDYFFQSKAEYIDLYFFCENNIKLENSVFIKLRNDDKLILPSYFEPFVFSNPIIHFAYKLTKNINYNPVFFKGDCDQDRPS